VIPFFVPYAALKDTVGDRGVFLRVPGWSGDSSIPSLADGDWGRLNRGMATHEFIYDTIDTVVQHLTDPNIEQRRRDSMVTTSPSLSSLSTYSPIMMTV
jgi:hypothetical protein